MREVIIIHNEIEHSYVLNIHKLQIFEFGLKPWAICTFSSGLLLSILFNSHSLLD